MRCATTVPAAALSRGVRVSYVNMRCWLTQPLPCFRIAVESALTGHAVASGAGGDEIRWCAMAASSRFPAKYNCNFIRVTGSVSRHPEAVGMADALSREAPQNCARQAITPRKRTIAVEQELRVGRLPSKVKTFRPSKPVAEPGPGTVEVFSIHDH